MDDEHKPELNTDTAEALAQAVGVPQPDTDAAIGFLCNWDDKGPWTLVAIKATTEKGEKPHVRAASFTDTAPMRAWIADYNGRWNLYFVPNRCDPSVTSSPEKQHMTFMRCFHLDLDLPKGAEGTAEEYAELLERIHRCDPQPHNVNFSGGGYQCFWLFNTERPCAEWLERVEECNKTILKQVGGDGSCWNANRLMRLPGTINMLSYIKRRRGRTLALAYVVEENWDAPRWSFETDVLPRVEGPVSAAGRGGDDNDAQPNTIDALPAKLRKAILKGDASKYGGDRSDLVWYVTCSLVRQGWPDELITALLTDKDIACAAHVLDQSNPQQYAVKQVRKAKEAVATGWQRNERGQILTNSQSNIKKALAGLGVRFGYNAFDDKSYVYGDGPLRELQDHEVIQLRLSIDTNYQFLPNDALFFQVITALARESSYHPVAAFLAKNEPLWDGVRRIGDAGTPSWLTTYGGAEDTPYTRAVGRLQLIAAVRRIRQPGCKHDEILVLITPDQGTNKSSALAILATRPEWFSDSFPLHAKDKQIIEHLQGSWIIECGELAGIRQAEIEEVKSLLSRQVDRARMAYGRLQLKWPRQCVFFGTTNEVTFLTDSQNRRWWPVTVVGFNLDLLERDVHQLWAEAAQAESARESIILDRELWSVAAQVQEHHKAQDLWVDALKSALGHIKTGKIFAKDLLDLFNVPEERKDLRAHQRLGKAMKEVEGWKHSRYRLPSGKPMNGYYLGEYVETVPFYRVVADQPYGDGPIQKRVEIWDMPAGGTYESYEDATRPKPNGAAAPVEKPKANDIPF